MMTNTTTTVHECDQFEVSGPVNGQVCIRCMTCGKYQTVPLEVAEADEAGGFIDGFPVLEA